MAFQEYLLLLVVLPVVVLFVWFVISLVRFLNRH